MFPLDRSLAALESRVIDVTGADRPRVLCELAWRLCTREPERAKRSITEALELLAERDVSEVPDRLRLQTCITAAACFNRCHETTLATEVLEEATALVDRCDLVQQDREKFRSRIADGTGETLFNIGSPVQSTERLEQALDILGESADPESLEIRARIFNNLGIARYLLSDYPGSLSSFNEAKDHYREIGDEEGELRVNMNIGNVHSCLGEFTTAVERYQESLKFARRVGHPRTEATGLANIASAYVKVGEADDAIEACLESIGIWRRIGDKRGESIALSTLALGHRLKGQYTLGLTYSYASLSILEELDDQPGVAMGLKTLGFILLNDGQFSEAREQFEQGLELSRKVDLRRIEVLCLMGLGKTYMAQDLYPEALTFLEEGVVRSEEQNEADSTFTLHRELSRCYRALGQFETAIDHYELSHEHERRLSERKSDSRLKSLQVQLQVEQARRRAAAELEAVNEQLRAEIHERRRAEDERKELQHQLQHSQKMEAVGRLAGGVAHDFNNLLTIILGYCELLGEHQSTEEEREEAVDEVSRAASRAAELTQQLLTFSRKRVLRPRAIPLNTLIEDLQRMLDRLLDDTITIRLLLESTVGAVLADPVLLEQILINLALNAQDAMPEGGTLTITTGVERLSNQLIDALQLDPSPMDDHGAIYYSLRVSDTGSGIPADIRDRVFEPFFTTKDHGKGTGLGLSIVYGVVGQCGGSIRVDSTPDQGSTFTVLLPPTLEKPVERPAIVPDERPTPSRGETVLLVEDEPGVRGLLETMLRAEGYLVLGARDGEAALNCARRQKGPIHLLITDVLMPRMSGTELAQQLVQFQPEIKMVFTSGYMDRVAHEISDLPEGSIFLQKPFSLGRLRHKLRRLLAGSSQLPT